MAHIRSSYIYLVSTSYDSPLQFVREKRTKSNDFPFARWSLSCIFSSRAQMSNWLPPPDD